MIIPTEVKSYKETDGKNPVEIVNDEDYFYEPVKGERIKVKFWVRYPSYDFIFGVPTEDNPRHEKEIGFFQYRDTRTKKVMLGMYVDIDECEEIIKGFENVLLESKTNSIKLWKQKNQSSN